MIQIYAVRHGPVNVSGLCYGQIDVEPKMSAAASIAQVQLALANLSTVDAVWTSPLSRCRSLADAFDSAYQVDKRLMEMSFGRWEGMSWTDIYDRYPIEMDAWGANWYDVAPPDGESAQMLESRVTQWASALTAGNHLVFTHAGVIRSLRVLCHGSDWERAIKEPVPYLTPESFDYSF